MKTILSRIVLLFALALSACSRPIRSASAADPSTALSSGNHDLSMSVDGRERTYILHVPASEGEALPLIIVLHGTYGTGRKMQLGLGFDPYADERGFLVAYPDAYQKPGENETARWNDGRGTLESSYGGIDDVKFIVDMIDDIAARTPLERERIFVTGASNGGMMTYRLGCETVGVFAGIAPVIGNIPEPIFASCNPQTPLKFLAINGDADPFVPLNGGEVCENVRFGCEGGWVVSGSDSLGAFAAANGCSLQPTSETLPTLVEDGTQVERLIYADCGNNARVEAYIIHNGGHTWPPREPQLASGGKSTANLDATAVIVDFFLP